MSKMVKDLMTEELQSRYSDQSNAVWIELVGLDGNSTNEFRRALRGHEMRLEVVKTSLFRRAVKDRPLEPLGERLSGPASLVTGGETAIDVAKVLDEWLPKLKKNLTLRGAVLEGEFIDEEGVKTLHKMPSRVDLQAKIVGIVMAPGRNVVGAAVAPGRNVMGCVKAMIDKLENGEEIKKIA